MALPKWQYLHHEMLADELNSWRCKNGSRYFAHPGSNVASYNWRHPLAAKGVVCSQENTLSQSQQAGQLPKVWFSFFSAVKYEVSRIITFLLSFFRAIPFWCLLIPFCCCYAFWVFASLFFFRKNKRFLFFFLWWWWCIFLRYCEHSSILEKQFCSLGCCKTSCSLGGLSCTYIFT